MNKEYKAFKINFVSKGYIRSDQDKSKINGTAYYIVDGKFNIIKQFLQIQYATFRPTDKEMMKTSYYNSNSSSIKIRKEILEDIQVNHYKINPFKISKNEKIRLEIPQKYLKEINNKLLEMNVIKKSIDIFTGSNSSGAESNPRASNIMSYQNSEKEIMDGMNFTNPLNSKSIYKKKNITIKNLKQIQTIPFKDFLEKNKFAKNLIDRYNCVLYFMFNNDWGDHEIDFIKNNKELKVKIMRDLTKEECEFQIKDYIKNKKQVLLNSSLEELKKEKNKLRFWQKVLIQYEKEHLFSRYANKDRTFFNNFLIESNYQNCKHCHIIPVKKYSKDNIDDWFEIADNNNCLLLSPNIHDNFDNKIIAFYPNGCCINIQSNEIIKNFTLKKEILNNDRKKYLKRYFNEVLNKKLIPKKK